MLFTAVCCILGCCLICLRAPLPQLWEDAVRATASDVARIQAALQVSGHQSLAADTSTSSDVVSVTGSVLSQFSSANTSTDFGTMRNQLVVGVAKVRQRLRDSMSAALRKVQDKVCLLMFCGSVGVFVGTCTGPCEYAFNSLIAGPLVCTCRRVSKAMRLVDLMC